MKLSNSSALITGITGQDGAYLAEFLLNKGYRVFGAFRRTASVDFWRLRALSIDQHPKLQLLEYDLTDLGACIRLLEKAEASEVYNLAAQSFVGASFEQPNTTAQITGLGALNMLEAIRIVDPTIRFYQASTSEMFGKAQSVPQNENTVFYPRSPYGTAKLFAHWSTINYRESYDMFTCSGILFNHESPLRGLEFVTRKITHAIARIKTGQTHILELGNLDAQRDWGFAKDYVEGMYLMMQQSVPDTFVLSTGRTETVRRFVELACTTAQISIQWQGTGPDELGIDPETGQTLVRINPHYYRPAEVDLLIGDASKAEQELGWKASTELETLAEMMVHADMSRLSGAMPS